MRETRWTRWITLGMVLVILLSACAGGGASKGAGGPAAPPDNAAAPEDADTGGDQVPGGDDAANPGPQDGGVPESDNAPDAAPAEPEKTEEELAIEAMERNLKAAFPDGANLVIHHEAGTMTCGGMDEQEIPAVNDEFVTLHWLPDGGMEFTGYAGGDSMTFARDSVFPSGIFFIANGTYGGVAMEFRLSYANGQTTMLGGISSEVESSCDVNRPISATSAQ